MACNHDEQVPPAELISQDLASGPSAAELEAAIVTAKIARGLTMESPTSALQAMAFGTVDASGLDGVTAASVKAAAAVACKTGLTVASVGNVGEVCIRWPIFVLVLIFFGSVGGLEVGCDVLVVCTMLVNLVFVF